MAVELILGDCLDVMRGMADGSVDAIVTDPPYGQSNESYDKGVPSEVWRECFRVARPNAALISFAGSPTYHRIASGIEAAGWKVRQMWGWVYKDGMITSAWPKEGFDRLSPAFTPICYATKGKVLLRLEREGDPWELRQSRGCEPTFSARSLAGQKLSTAPGHWPKSIVTSEGIDGFQYIALGNNVRGEAKGEKTGHPNQKPLALMRWLVSKLPAGGIILDPYAGSATTLVAAEAEGFDAIGIESDPTHFATAERRINAARSAHPLFAGAS